MASLAGSIGKSDNLINSLHVGWIRSRQDFNVIRPSTSSAKLALPALIRPRPIALAPGLVLLT